MHSGDKHIPCILLGDNWQAFLATLQSNHTPFHLNLLQHLDLIPFFLTACPDDLSSKYL